MSTFFDQFSDLCKTSGTSPNAVAKILGISSGSITAWKKGTVPRIDTIQKIADYFEVTVDRLTGAETNTNDIQMDDFTFAMHGESRRLSDRDKSILLKMAREMAAATEEEMQNGNTD